MCALERQSARRDKRSAGVLSLPGKCNILREGAHSANKSNQRSYLLLKLGQLKKYYKGAWSDLTSKLVRPKSISRKCRSVETMAKSSLSAAEYRYSAPLNFLLRLHPKPRVKTCTLFLKEDSTNTNIASISVQLNWLIGMVIKKLKTRALCHSLD